MKNQQIKKLAFAALLIALGVVCSSFAIPVGASKCLPTQHAVNVLAGVFLGPVYSCSMAFITSLIRLMLGTGSLLAFPGSMIGALLCGLAFKYGKRLWCAFAGEVFEMCIRDSCQSRPCPSILHQPLLPAGAVTPAGQHPAQNTRPYKNREFHPGVRNG